jgi:hypothetical protein
MRHMRRMAPHLVPRVLRLRRLCHLRLSQQGSVPFVRGWAPGPDQMVKRFLRRLRRFAWVSFVFAVFALCAAIITAAATGNL